MPNSIFICYFYFHEASSCLSRFNHLNEEFIKLTLCSGNSIEIIFEVKVKLGSNRNKIEKNTLSIWNETGLKAIDFALS